MQCSSSVGFTGSWMLGRGRTESLVGWAALGAPAWGCFAQGAPGPAGTEGMLCTEGMIHPSAISVPLLCSELQSIQRAMPRVLLNYSSPCEGEVDRGGSGFPLRYYMEGVSIFCDWVQFRGVDA